MSAQERLEGRLQAAAWLKERAATMATGSRDFGRGYALAVRMLEESTVDSDLPGEVMRIECYVCHREVGVTRNGLVVKHTNPPGHREAECDGSMRSYRVHLAELVDGTG